VRAWMRGKARKLALALLKNVFGHLRKRPCSFMNCSSFSRSSIGSWLQVSYKKTSKR
jgi:hypothetical protein